MQLKGHKSGLRETFVKRYIAERTNKAELRPEKQSEKAESCRENAWNEIQLKGSQRHKQTQEQNEMDGQAQFITHAAPSVWNFLPHDIRHI